MSAVQSPENQKARDVADVLSSSTLTRLAAGLLLLGLLWRVVRYLLCFPIWGDEAMLATNFAMHDCWTLFHRLDNCQIAPLLFLWGERLMYVWLGSSELSMRLLPFVGGVLALGLFWHWTGLILAPRERLFAVGFLAVAIWPVSMCSLLKPYSWDLLMSMALVVPATHYLLQPTRAAFLVILIVLTPVALLGSFPAVFVGGAISLALLVPVWNQGWGIRAGYALYNLMLILSFLLVATVGANQLQTPVGDTTTQHGMTLYWKDSFPPPSPWAFLPWLLRSLTGQMMAYPMGVNNGGSTATFLLVLVGIACWSRQRKATYLLLALVPIALNLVAAIPHRYPFGASGRLSQHLAPGICALAGVGLATLIERLVSRESLRTRYTLAWVLFFALVGIGGIVKDYLVPYREPYFAWLRTTMSAIRAEVEPTAPVVISGPTNGIEPVFSWYWLQEGDRVTWNRELPSRLGSLTELWYFHHGDEPGATSISADLLNRLRSQDAGWQLDRRTAYIYQPKWRNERLERFETIRFHRQAPDGGLTAAVR